MAEFYHNIITEKSFKFLRELKNNCDFILIGGWAVFLYSHALKSKDIDIVIDYPELAKLKEKYDVFKNERLKKYEIKMEETDIDIYLPHYSDLGIDIGQIKPAAREGFYVPELETLFLLKLYAWQERRGSLKGQKDELDIFSLAILPEFRWKNYLVLTKDFGMEKNNADFIALLKKSREVKELGINEQKMSKIRKKIFKELGYDR